MVSNTTKIFCSLLLLSICAQFLSERIYIITQKREKLYNYFPLKCSYLVFNVKADNDAHITLTETYNQLGAFYEIVIGGWSNTKSVIRKDNLGNEVLAHQGTILKNSIFQRIWLSLNDTEGSISVGRWNEKPFMYYKDPFYTKMAYFGIATGFGAAGEWYFDDGYLTCDLVGCNLGLTK